MARRVLHPKRNTINEPVLFRFTHSLIHFAWHRQATLCQWKVSALNSKRPNDQCNKQRRRRRQQQQQHHIGKYNAINQAAVCLFGLQRFNLGPVLLELLHGFKQWEPLTQRSKMRNNNEWNWKWIRAKTRKRERERGWNRFHSILWWSQLKFPLTLW